MKKNCTFILRNLPCGAAPDVIVPGAVFKLGTADDCAVPSRHIRFALGGPFSMRFVSIGLFILGGPSKKELSLGISQ